MKNNVLLILLVLNVTTSLVGMEPSFERLLFVNKEGIVTKGDPFVITLKEDLVGQSVYDALPLNQIGKQRLATTFYNVDQTKEEQVFCYKLHDKEIKVMVTPCVVMNKVMSYCVKQRELSGK